MMNFIKPEYLVSLYLILNDKKEVSLKDLGDYAGKLNIELRERKIEAVFLFSDKYIDEMLFDYKNYFVNNDFNYCTPWIKRKVSNEVLSEKFTAYLSNDVLKVACDLKTKETIMTTEEKIEVMKAYTEGKKIQGKAAMGEQWWDDANPTWDWNHNEYRVKPESSCRPYKGIEEMLENISKRLVAIQHPVFPGVWLKRKDCDVEVMIDGIDYANSYILIGPNWLSLGSVFFQYNYLDGTPFGIKE